MERCTNCGAQVRAGTKFCTACGARLVATSEGGTGSWGAGAAGETEAESAESSSGWPWSRLRGSSATDTDEEDDAAPAEPEPPIDGDSEQSQPLGDELVDEADVIGAEDTGDGTDARDGGLLVPDRRAPDQLVRATALLEELRALLPDIASAAPADLDRVAQELEAVRGAAAMSEVGLEQLRSTLEVGRERPRDIDTFMALATQIDTIQTLYDAHREMTAVIDRALAVLRWPEIEPAAADRDDDEDPPLRE